MEILKSEYTIDPILEQMLSGQDRPSRDLAIIRRLRILKYISRHQLKEGGLKEKDIRKAYIRAVLNPVSVEDFEKHNYKLKHVEREVQKLLAAELVQKDSEGNLRITANGMNLTNLRFDKRSKKTLFVLNYLKAIENAFPFNVEGDWQKFMGEKGDKLERKESDIQDVQTLIEFEKKNKAFFVQRNGNEILERSIDVELKRMITGLLDKMYIDSRLYAIHREYGTDQEERVKWFKCSFNYKSPLKRAGKLGGKRDKNDIIPLMLKQYNLNWYLIGVGDIDDKEHKVYALDRITGLVFSETECWFPKEKIEQRIEKVREYYKATIGLIRLGDKTSEIEFKIKDGGRHLNKSYIINEIIHDNLKLVNGQNNIEDEYITFTLNNVYYGPELWRFLRKWGAQNVKGIWPKKLYLDFHEDDVITFSNKNDRDELFVQDDYGKKAWNRFVDKMTFLGNMVESEIQYKDQQWKSAEALFQSLRFEDKKTIEEIRTAEKAFFAKQIAKNYSNKRTVNPESNEDIKNMEKVLWLKFTQNEDLRNKLLATGNALIIEDAGSRKEKDRALFWGAVYEKDKNNSVGSANWHGKNMLGKLLMLTREKLRIESINK